MGVTYKNLFLFLTTFSSLVIITSYYMGGRHAVKEKVEVRVMAHSASTSNSSTSDTKRSALKGRVKARVTSATTTPNRCLNELNLDSVSTQKTLHGIGKSVYIHTPHFVDKFGDVLNITAFGYGGCPDLQCMIWYDTTTCVQGQASSSPLRYGICSITSI